MAKIAQILESSRCFLGSSRFWYLSMQHSPHPQWPPEDIHEETPENHYFQILVSYVKRYASGQTKKKTL